MENVFTTFYDLSKKGQENSVNCVNCVKPLNYQTLPSKNETEEREGYYERTARPVGKSRITSTRPGLNQYKTPITKMLQRVAMIFAVLVMSVANVGVAWGETYTWSFANGSGTISETTTNFTSTSGGKILIYDGGKSCGWDGDNGNKYLKMGGSSSYSNETPSDRFFKFLAPSSSGTVSISYAGTVNTTEISAGSNGSLVWDVITPTANETSTSKIISGLTAGSTYVYISCPANKSYIKSITWTDAALPYERVYYSEMKTCVWETALESGASFTAHNSIGFNGKAGSGWNSYFSNYLTVGSSGGYATATFSPALSLTSNGVDKGRIRVYFSAGSGSNKNISLEMNGNSAGSYNAAKAYRTYVAEYTIPDATSNISTLKMYQSGNSGIVIFAIEVLTYPGASSWKLKGSFDSWGDGYAMSGSGTVSATVSLAADTRYTFKLKEGETWYGNGGTILATTSGWEFSSGGSDTYLHTGPAGDYTFTLNTSNRQVSVTYPTVVHPNSHYAYYKNRTSWAKVYGYLYGDGDNKSAGWPGTQLTETVEICDVDYYWAAVNGMGGTYTHAIFNNGSSGDGNQTWNLPISGSGAKYNDYQDGNWYDLTYIITYDKGTGTGTMEPTSVCVGADQVLPSNTFEKPGYNFASWTASASVKVGGSSVTTGIADGATIQDVAANVTLTAQWAPILVTGITVDPASKTLDVGGTQELTATATPATALDKTVNWTSSNDAIATVSSTGLVTAKAPGSCTITATANDGSLVTGTCSITVNKIQPTKYSFTADNTSICSGSNVTFTLAGSQSGATYYITKNAAGGDAIGDSKAGTGSAITFTVSNASAGDYYCYTIENATYTAYKVSNSKETISHKTATSITSQPTGIADATVGEEQTLSVTAAGTNLSYQWQESATEDGTYSDVASDGTSASYSVTPAAAGTKWYQVVVTGDCGEVTSNKVSIVAAEGDCTPINASITFDNNKSAKYNTAWADGDVATSGGASWNKNSIGSDSGHPMTKPAMKLDDTGDYIKITLPSGVATGTITVLACTYSGKTGTLIINDENNSDTPLASAEVGLVESTQTYKINTPDGESWTAPTLKTVSYNITSGGDYYIKQSAGNSIYIYAFSATGTKECACSTPSAPTSPTNGATTSNSQAVSWTDASNSAWEVYVSTGSSTPAADQTPTAEPTSASYTFTTGLTASTTYYWWVRSVCDATHKSDWVAGSPFTTSAAASLYTVTFKSNGGSSVSPITQGSEGASIAKPSDPTRASYSFDGWYKTDGTKVDWSYTPTADITLYARWQEACDAGAGNVATFNFNSGSESGLTIAYENETKITGAIVNTKTNDIPVLDSYYYNVSYSGNSSGVAIITTNSAYSEIDSIKFNSAASGASDPKITIYGVKKNGNDSTALSSSILLYNGSANNAWRAMPYNLDIHGKSPKYSGKVRFKLTTGSSGKKAGIDNIQIFYGGGSGTCRHIYYHGNGAESGFVSDTTSYADGAKATVLSYNDSRYPLAKAGNDFQGWATSADGAVAYTAGEKITIDGADVHLYAVWATASSALVNWTMSTNTSTWSASSTSTTDGTNISTIATSRTAGSDGKYEGATAKVTMADAEVTGTAAPSNSANFTFTIAGGKQVEINKFDCKVYNVSSGNRTYKAQISDAAGNVYNSTNKVAVSAEATLTDASFVFGSEKILRGAVTIRVYAWDTDDSNNPTEFRMGPDIKFYGTVEDYVCADPSAPTISGVSAYVPGEAITLTASHDGENYDNLTTYTWYKGADWATASGSSPVQAAATGEGGYTLTIDDCTTGNAGLYWCKVSNGTGCDAHNSEGYNIIVYPTYTITYNLNGGDWGEVEHKDSYTQFDEDYTLPTPTKTGYVFAGWYGASDFSGLPTVVLGAGSVGDKEYYAKWGAVVTVSWTVDDELYRGGGGYSVKAVIDQTAWSTGFMDELELTATEGVTLKNIEVSENGESKVQVTADFDITTGLAADATEITFTLDVPADGTYGPKVDEYPATLTSCAGSSTVWDFTTNAFLNGGSWSTSSSNTNNIYATDNTTILKYTVQTSDDVWDAENAQLKTSGKTKYSTGSAKKQMTQCFFQFPTLSGKGTIGVTYGSTSGKLEIYETTSNNIYGLEPIITLTSSSTTSAAYTFDSDKKYYMIMPDGKAYFKRIIFTASSGGITPTLSWDPALNTDADWDSGNNRLNKETGDPDFTFVANQNKNSLGAITYESSDPAVATVNAAGTVHIVGSEGDATITATLAASGCFNKATATYNIHVVDNCIDEPGTITSRDLGCDGTELTVSGHTATASVSYQWYKDGASLGGSYTNPTCTVTVAGEYYVVVDNSAADGDHCAMASTNTIKVAAKAAISVPTNIVDSWYVKNGRRTPDIALWKTTGVSTFTVKNNDGGAEIENIGGCTFELKDGIIYLKGTTSTGAAPSEMEAGDLVIKVEVKDECGSNTRTSSTIIIHCQAATTYKEIAFVADGGKGMKKDSITVGHGDGTELYEYLDSVGTAAENRLFKLSERNIYWTTDEKVIREEYSQFDAILITDDPSTNTVVKKGDDYKTKGYVNAFGTMVDVRPIFTMEAYVSALKNWGSKGIKGSPESPNPRQYEMRLECKDHEIYGAGLPDPSDGTNVWEETIGGEIFRHVILVDSTQGIYNGVKYNKETKGNEKPALQGFTGEAAGSLLGLGRILEGTLQAAIERQEEPAARLLVMGINAKALQPTCALTNEGKTVIKNILIYLLKTNMEEVDDCSNYFTGGASGTDTDWNKASNWSKNQLPSSEAKVRILAPCVISGIQPHVLQVSIVNSGNSNIRYNATGNAVCNGTLTINADGALIADGKVRSAVAPHFAANDLMPTTPEMLTINTGSDGQAALIFNNDEASTKATVNYYSLGRKKDGAYQFQYFAVPMEYVDVNPAFAGSGIYTYVWHENGGWERRGYYTELYAFEGVGITTKFNEASHNYTMKGTLASTAEKEITLTKGADGDNIIGNSWMAPINIASLKTALVDDDNVDEVVYIYCTGNDKTDGDDDVDNSSTETAGQWLAIPIDASGWSGWSGLKVIPAMQAFLIHANAETTLTLNYKDHVRSTALGKLNEPLRAPHRTEARSEDFTGMRMSVADSQTHTDLYLFEGEQFSADYDNGWEAKYMEGDGRSAQFYAMNGEDKMAVMATDELEGTPVCFAPGKESNYTISFFGGEGTYYLNDLKEEKSTLIEQGNTYSFTYEQGDMPHRFLISTTPFGIPSVTTGVGTVEAQEKVQKVIYNDHVYIIRGGQIYDVMGKMMK